MNEVTQILSDLARGDGHAAGQLLPLVYEELRKLAAARVVCRAREKRKQHFQRRKPDTDVESEIAIVRDENVLAALERHRRACLDRFMSLAGRRERNLALTVEFKAASFETAVHEHGAQDRNKLFVGQSAPF